MSTASIVHFVLLISFAAVVGWLWRGHQLEQRAWDSELQAEVQNVSVPSER